jgi:hypothetical protein
VCPDDHHQSADFPALQTQCCGLVIDNSIFGVRIVREWDQIAKTRVCPLMVVGDSGTEMTSQKMTGYYLQIRK